VGILLRKHCEKSNPSAARDNAWSQPVAEPRNLGFVHVTRAFETVREGSWDGRQTLGNTIIRNFEPAKINITSSVVDSNGSSNTFQRPDKPGKVFTQTGIVWLTNLPAGTSAERSKLIRLANGRYVALWEEWAYSGNQLDYQTTKSMIINEQGQILNGPASLSARLNPSGADRPFVLDGKAAWITGDAKTGTFRLYSVDTNLILSNATIDPSGSPQPTTYTDHLSAGDTLKLGDKLQSNNGLYTLVYQTDGNLALYTAQSKYLWGTGTVGQPGYATMQTDGNFAIYGSDGGFRWNTGTTTAGSRLVLGDDGNLVVATTSGTYLWASNTYQAVVRDRLKAGEKLLPGDKLQCADGRFSLIYQNNGDLVLYKSDSTPLWSSGTNGRPAGYATMQTDGNFAIYGPDGGFQWNTGTVTSGSFMVLQIDGNLVVYTPALTPIWVSNTAQ